MKYSPAYKSQTSSNLYHYGEKNPVKYTEPDHDVNNEDSTGNRHFIRHGQIWCSSCSSNFKKIEEQDKYHHRVASRIL